MIINKTNYTIDCFHSAPLVDGVFKSKGIDRKRHLLQALPSAKLTGHVLEFGVYRGKTMAHISAHFQNQTVYGFDSFVGLPEPWYIRSGDEGKTHPAGKFDMRLEPVQPVFAENVELVPGWFQDSIPLWKDLHPGIISFLHVDCDLYSSTRDVLTLLNDRIVPGTVIVFDEMYPWSEPEAYDLWAEGEYRALGEWLDDYDREFSPLLRSGHQQCSIIVTQ
jgi:predicted O-methyltransferase YrrM